jgi:hypothetical protein
MRILPRLNQVIDLNTKHGLTHQLVLIKSLPPVKKIQSREHKYFVIHTLITLRVSYN